MKTILKNTMLVAVLAGLFAMPLGGFGFIGLNEKTPESSAQVLGVQSFTPARSYSDDYALVSQIELELNLSDSSTQTFYNVIPEEFLTNQYKQILVIPNEYKEDGVIALIENNSLSADIVLNLNNPDLEGKSIPVTILILSK